MTVKSFPVLVPRLFASLFKPYKMFIKNKKNKKIFFFLYAIKCVDFKREKGKESFFWGGSEGQGRGKGIYK